METIRGNAHPQARAASTADVAVGRSHATPSATARSRYLAALGTLFGLFSSARVLAYLPTIWAVVASGNSSQHSLLTWFTFLGGNATMAAWLWEHNGRRCNAAIASSGGNALMCLAVIVVVAWARL